MAFKPNYRQQRVERDRAARARNAEKQQRLEEKAAERKAARMVEDAPAESESSTIPSS
jgi:hypothetical protein